MIAGIILFLVLVSASVFFEIYFDEPFEKTIPISLLGIIFIMYIFGLLNILIFGIYFILIAAFVLYAAIAYHSFKTRAKTNIKKIINGPFVIFSLFFFLTMYANRGIRPHVWDEFSHWILAVKSMCYHDALFTKSLDPSINYSYPPGITLFQYFYSRWIMMYRKTDIFPVGAAYAALQILQMSFVFPLIKRNNLKNIFSTIMTLMVLFVFPLFFFDGIYRNAYADSIMGILLGASFATVALTSDKERNYFYDVLILFECAFFILTKRVGIMPAVSLGGAYILGCICDIRFAFKDRWKELLTKAAFTLFSIAIPLGIYRIDIRRVVASSTSIEAVTSESAVPPAPVSLDLTSTKAFFEKLYTLTYDIGYTRTVLPMFLVPLLGIIALYIIYSIYQKFFKEDKSRIAYMGLYCIFIALAWIGSYLVLAQVKIEDAVLHSFDRYISPCFMPVVYIVLFAIYNFISVTPNHKNKIASLLVIAFLLVIEPMAEPVKFIDGSYRDYAYEYYSPLQTLCEKLESLELSEDDRIYYICQEDNGFFRYQMRYYAYPTTFVNAPAWFSDGIDDPDFPEKAQYSSTINADELLDIFEKENVTHVMIFRTDDYFINNFTSLFDSDTPIDESSIYKFDKDLKLLKIAN